MNWIWNIPKDIGWGLFVAFVMLGCSAVLILVGAVGLAIETDNHLHICPEHGKRHHCVHDGDTVWWHGTKTRAVDYDTPELTSYGSFCPERETRLARAARDRLVDLLNSGKVVVEETGRTGRSGRALARYYVDGVAVGPVLIGEGLALPWTGKRRREFWCNGDLD